MSQSQRIIFEIDAYSPETIPMGKLAEYMVDFAALLGKENAVHFVGLASGSTKLVALVKYEDAPKVAGRLEELRRGMAAKEAIKLFEQIDRRLSNDNATGRIYFDGQDVPAEPLAFPGRDRPKALVFGPFNQEGHLDGVLISVGGKDETVSVRLQNGDVTYSNCDTNRSLARDLGKHLFEPIRIYGVGRWSRGSDSAWTLLRFRVSRFETLKQNSLRDIVGALRDVRSGWGEFDDPLAELAELRRDEDELH